MTDGQRPNIERITIQVRLPGKQPIQYVLSGDEINKYCGIGWGHEALASKNLFEHLTGLPKSGSNDNKKPAGKRWMEQHSPLPAFLLKLPDCECDTPHDVWGF